MVEQARSTNPSVLSQGAKPTPKPMLGTPGSGLRWLLPILLCAGALALGFVVVVFVPMSHTVSAEPDIVIHAVLADSLFLLQIRMWTILLTAVLLGGAIAVHGARLDAKALLRLELRLRRIADGETELPPTDLTRDFVQFDEVFAYLRSGMERAMRRHRSALQQMQTSVRTFSQQLAAGNASPDELRKSLSAISLQVETMLEADRRAGAAKQRI